MNKNKIIIKVLFWLTVIFFMTLFASLFIELGSIFEIIGFFSFNILLLLAIVYFKFIKKDKIQNMGLFKKNISTPAYDFKTREPDETAPNIESLPEYHKIKDFIARYKTVTLEELIYSFSDIDSNLRIDVVAALINNGIVSQEGYVLSYYQNTTPDLSYIDSLTTRGLEFEEFTVRLLSRNGFTNVRKTQGSGDYGIDVLAEKEGITYAIQCKCYSDKVGNKAVQEAYSGKSFYNCMVAAVLTNNYFTKAAEETAKANNVLLWDRNKLKDFLKAYNDNNSKPDEKSKELFTSKLKEISYVVIETMNSNGIGCSVKDIFTDSKGVLYVLYCSDTITESVISSIADAISSPNAYLCESADPDIKKLYFDYPESMKILCNNYMGIK